MIKTENEIFSLLENNYIEDLKKNDLDKFERCKVLKSIMERHKLNPHTLAKKLNKPKTTIQDWLLYAKIDNKKYEKLKKEGFRDTDIFRSLRNSKKVEDVEKIEFKKYTTGDPTKLPVIDLGLDDVLKKDIKELSPYVLRGVVTRDTIDLIIELKSILNRIQERAEALRR